MTLINLNVPFLKQLSFQLALPQQKIPAFTPFLPE